MNTISEEILEVTNKGLDVFYAFLPANFTVGRKFRNPFYDDKNASCHVYFDKHSGRYRINDFGNEEYKGDCFDFVAKINGLNAGNSREFCQVVEMIIDTLHLHIPSYKKGGCSASIRQASQEFARVDCDAWQKSCTPKAYSFKQRAFTKSELDYWGKYGITLPVLCQYHIVALDEFSSEGSNGLYTIRSGVQSPMFGYVGDKHLKIYRPKDKNRFMYAGTLPSPYCFGMAQLPSHGDVVFITGGEKDVMSLAAHGFYAICFNSETATIPHSIIDMLSLRFQHIVIMYDCDETGLASMEKARSELGDFGVLTLRLPLSGMKPDKDISDFFAAGHTANELQALLVRNIEQLHSQSLQLLDTCELNYATPPEKSRTIISVANVPLGTCDNLCCVSGSEGTGKSNFISALISGTLLSHDDLCSNDTLGFTIAPNKESKAVLHFDTEQSEFQLYKNVDSSIRRAGIDIKPDFYHVYHIINLSRAERLRAIRNAMDYFHFTNGGIHLVVVDGIADLIRSANDETESIGVVEELYRLARMYHTCVVCVLHLVPNGLKLRGHIGSELQRKAASILSIEKDGNTANSVVKTLKVRDGNPLDVPMLMFKWDKDADMFVSNGQKTEEERKANAKEMLRMYAQEAYEGAGIKSYSYNALTSKLMEVASVQERTAKNYINRMVANNIIAKSHDGYYIL